VKLRASPGRARGGGAFTMDRLSIISESRADSEDVRKPLADMFDIQWVGPNCLHESTPDAFTIVDLALGHPERMRALRDWLKRKPKNAKALFVVDAGSRVDAVRAQAIGATDIVHRPINRKALVDKLLGDFGALSGQSPEFDAVQSAGVASAYDALQDIFSSACLGGALKPSAINAASEPIIRHIETEGLASWVDTVRKHHSQTYQHSLLVTGTAVAFARHLGLSNADRERLSFAGMLHDIGKARIPIAILEKPGPLDADETAVMRQHPQFGFEALAATTDVPKEMVDMVVHHHEYLDGSGYPHGLQANEISDLVRVMTISDIFGALLERRSYKPPITADTAYDILVKMGPKLDKALVREFRFVSELRLAA
jgi:putative nucleotidyltransferase with HDIG domain